MLVEHLPEQNVVSNGPSELVFQWQIAADDEDRDDSDAPPDDADDALGPEDGEGEIDEVNMLGYATF